MKSKIQVPAAITLIITRETKIEDISREKKEKIKKLLRFIKFVLQLL